MISIHQTSYANLNFKLNLIGDDYVVICQFKISPDVTADMEIGRRFKLWEKEEARIHYDKICIDFYNHHKYLIELNYFISLQNDIDFPLNYN